MQWENLHPLLSESLSRGNGNLIIGDEKQITCRPADLLKPELDNMRKECAEWMRQEEDVLSYALFGQIAVDFFKYREAQLDKVDHTLLDSENKVYPV